jgi:hypothetical protein
MHSRKGEWLRTCFAVAGAAAVLYVIGGWVLSRPVEAQSDMYLSRRIDLIEQRFYGIESRLNRIEQEAITRRASPGPQSPDLRAQDISMLQNEVMGLRLRLGEAECGLLKLDERTLTAARRMAGKGTAGSDRCRQDWGSPVQLTARP